MEFIPFEEVIFSDFRNKGARAEPEPEPTEQPERFQPESEQTPENPASRGKLPSKDRIHTATSRGIDHFDNRFSGEPLPSKFFVFPTNFLQNL